MINKQGDEEEQGGGEGGRRSWGWCRNYCVGLFEKLVRPIVFEVRSFGSRQA